MQAILATLFKALIDKAMEGLIWLGKKLWRHNQVDTRVDKEESEHDKVMATIRAWRETHPDAKRIPKELQDALKRAARHDRDGL